MNNTWEIISIINQFNDKINKPSNGHTEEKIEELYAQNLRLQCKAEYGHVLTTEDFITGVKSGSFTSYDGCGHLLTWDGEEGQGIKFNVKWLNHFKEDFPFVCWYNK